MKSPFLPRLRYALEKALYLLSGCAILIGKMIDEDLRARKSGCARRTQFRTIKIKFFITRNFQNHEALMAFLRKKLSFIASISLNYLLLGDNREK